MESFVVIILGSNLEVLKMFIVFSQGRLLNFIANFWFALGTFILTMPFFPYKYIELDFLRKKPSLKDRHSWLYGSIHNMSNAYILLESPKDGHVHIGTNALGT